MWRSLVIRWRLQSTTDSIASHPWATRVAQGPPRVKDRFDKSGYNPNWPLPVGLNKKVIGLMKDELGGEIMTEFVTLRPKMYAYKMGSAESKKCKGIKKCAVKKMISFEDYKSCLLSGGPSYRSQLMFRSSKHEVRTLEVNKLALSRDDDNCITVNGTSSLARGHYHTIKYNLYIWSHLQSKHLTQI